MLVKLLAVQLYSPFVDELITVIIQWAVYWALNIPLLVYIDRKIKIIGEIKRFIRYMIEKKTKSNRRTRGADSNIKETNCECPADLTDVS